MSFLQGLLGPPDVEKMNKKKLWKLMAALGLAVTSLLLLFLLLGQITVGAVPGEHVTITDARSASTSFTVSGTVTCEVTESGISDVEVFAWNRKGYDHLTATTDSNGYYSLTLEGSYDLNFHPPCGNKCASKAHKGITGPPDLTLNVVLPPGYTVSGTVYATGTLQPISNTAIYVFNHDTADGFGLPLTNNNGHYCVNLAEGYDDLSFTPPACLGLGPKAGIIVTQTMTRNVTLPPGFTVAGCVTDGSANPVSGVQIYAKDPDIGGFGFAPTNESGYYTGTLPYAGTPPTGTYDIQFIPPPGLGLGSITVIDVTSTTAGCPNTTLPITLPIGYTLSGKVTCKGVGIKNVFVHAEPEGPHDSHNSLPGWSLFTVDDGSYSLPLVSGTYSLEFTPPPATGLDTKDITNFHLITDTMLNVNLCGVCSGVWVVETVDSAGDVGRYTSLALAPTYPYTPHISYCYTDTNDSLKHAWLSGATWLSETVDSGGRWTSLALAPEPPHNPCISYNPWGKWLLKFACWDGTMWITKTVAAPGPGRDSSLALEPTYYPYTPHISYYYAWGTDGTLYHAYLSGTTWCGGTWVTETVEPHGSKAGSRSSLALEPTDPYTPHISYYDYNDGDLKYAWKSGTTWLTETVDSEVNVGSYNNSLALDSSGAPHISYFDDKNDSLKYAWLDGTTWLSETVDSIGQPPWDSGYTSLELDRADAPHISYYDATNDDLKLAHFNGTVWFIQTVDSGSDVGQYSSLALDQDGCPHISYYDATNGDLKYAYLPVFKIYLPIITKNR